MCCHARKITKETKTIKDGDEDGIGVNEDERGLEDVKVLVVAELAKHVISVVQKLTANGEPVANPESCSNLCNHHEHWEKIPNKIDSGV